MKKLRLLLLDANVVIKLFELGLWDQVLDRCEVVLSRTVAEQEVRFYHGKAHDTLIDLSADVGAGRVTLVEAGASELKAFHEQFDPIYFGEIDPGEKESLTFMLAAEESFLMSSSDHIVYRVLGLLGRSDQGVSLEEVLHKTGLGRKLEHRFTKAFREHWTRLGQQDRFRGIGLRKPKRK